LKRLFVLFFLFGLLFLPSPAGAKPQAVEGKRPSSTLYRQLDLFSKVLNLVRDDYVEDVDEKQMIYGAIQGLLATLDPHSVFMPPEVYRELKVDTEGRFGGVGLEVTLKDNILTVVTPIEGSPASRAGIREGDRILKIDGVSTKEMALTDAVRKMRGGRGTRVHLILLREGSREPFEVTLTRDIVRIKSVRYEMPEEGYGYVRVASFQEDTSEELSRAIEQLKRKTKDGLKGLIIDLRNNPGGLLDEAVSVADMFLESGVIVSTAGRVQEIDKRMATKEGTEADYPLILMVNGGTASAAEIVAGALQDHERAILLGTQTFGKGSVQTIFELGDGAALKLTVAKYYTPKGKSIQAEGIAPDIIADPRKGQARFLKDRGQREKDLRGHLEGEKKRAGPMTQPTAEDEDFQKKLALDYLKSWNVFQKK
jgi:carboxyl-terminal processing protease